MGLLSKKIDKQIAAYQRELIETHYAEVDNMYRQIRGWRHDYRNHIQVMKAYAAQGDWDAICRYLDELDTDLNTVDTVIKTGNPMTDAILNSKISLARSKGIEVHADAHIPVKLRLSELDLCCIIGNLFDNAIDASMGLPPEGRLIRVYMDMKNTQLYIRTYGQEKIIQPTMEESAFVPGGPIDRLYKGPWSMLASAASGTSAIFTGCVYIFACLKAWGGAFGIGSVTQYVGAATALAGNVAMFLETVNFISANAPFMEDTFRLLDTPNAMYQGSLTTEKRSDRQYHVEFRDVSFRYPGTENWALRHVNMKFKVGSRLAIVGENGSGKTTFIKLLCRLYDPQEGQILLNGIDIRKYNYRDHMDIFSVVFQDFQLLPQSLGANVAGSGSYDRERVKKALMDAGFEERMSAMPQGLDTQLYKDFAENGVEVSGGEAQKIAIARALYKDAPFIILDEPTAALDPMAEAEIYGKFNDIVTDKTAIYISHRLSSCKFCDEIAVFDQGQVVQQGTHDGLVEAEGKYRELWNAQAQYYTK